MWATWVSVAGFVAAAAAAVLPYLPKPTPAVTGLSPSARADWVNRLFALASQADAAGEAAVAAASRTLIAALVSEKELPSKKR